MIKKHIPNTLTALNLLCGMMGIYFVLKGQISYGAYFILIAALFDFLDGFVARMLNAYSEIGKQLDSLADLVTFGILPAFILFQMVKENADLEYMPFFTFLIGIFSAIRLAKFNIDTRQSDRFIGVPTPANAMLISTLPFFAEKFPVSAEWVYHPYFIYVFTIVMSFLLIAELPLIALKFKSFGLKQNFYRYLVLLIGLICIVVFGLAGIPMVIISYIVLSVVEGLLAKNA